MSTKYLIMLVFCLSAAAVVGYALGLRRPPVSSLSENREKISNHKLMVSASFYPLYYFASVVGGDRADVWNLTPAGVEPHDFEPTSQDIARIEKGDLLVLNGGVEAWGNKVHDMLKGTKVKTVVAGEGFFTQSTAESGKAVVDPHIWLSPPQAKKEIEAILGGFVSVDPDNKVYYGTNARGLEKEIDQLNEEYKTGLIDCQQRDFVTSHAAFGILAKTYGLTQVAIAGLSPDAEPSAKDLAEVVKLAKEKRMKFIFFESLVSPKLSETIASEIGAKTLVLDPIEGLAEEKLKAGRNYLTIMRDNLTNLRLALECTK